MSLIAKLQVSAKMKNDITIQHCKLKGPPSESFTVIAWFKLIGYKNIKFLKFLKFYMKMHVFL